jgi:hypothetical protein
MNEACLESILSYMQCLDTILKIRVQLKPSLGTVTMVYTLIDKPCFMQRHNESHIFTLSKHTGHVDGLRFCFGYNSR